MLLGAGMPFAIAASAALFLTPRVLAAAPLALLVENHRGSRIPAAGGAAVFLAVLVAEVPAVTGGWPAPGPERPSLHLAMLLAAAGLFGVGAFDDLSGGGGVRGFRGHWGALRAGKFTPGAIKALGGVLVAWIAAAGWSPAPSEALLDGVLVALTANLFNLLDKAPGRCAKTFLVGWAALAPFSGTSYLWLSSAAAGASAGWIPADLAERGMLGDGGANFLGAVAGVGMATTQSGGSELLALAGVIALTLVSERWSFSRAIQRLAPLRWADGLGRRKS